MKFIQLCALFIGAFLFLQPANAFTTQDPPDGVTCKSGETWLPSLQACGIVAPERSCNLVNIRASYPLPSVSYPTLDSYNSAVSNLNTTQPPPNCSGLSVDDSRIQSVSKTVTSNLTTNCPSSLPPDGGIVTVIENVIYTTTYTRLKATRNFTGRDGNGNAIYSCDITPEPDQVVTEPTVHAVDYIASEEIECPVTHPTGPQSAAPPYDMNLWCHRPPDRLPCDCSELQGMPKLPYGTFLAEKGVYTSSNLPECLDVVDSDTGQKCQCQFVAKKWLQFNAGFTHERWEPYPIENGGSSGTYTGAACNAEATSTAPDEKEECFTLKSGIKWCWANPDEKCSIVNGQEQCDSGCGYINGDFVCYETEEDPIIPKDPKPKDPIDDEITDPNKSINDMVKGDFKEVNRGIENRLNNVIITNENIESAVEGVENEVKKTNSKLDGIGKQLDGQGKTLKGIEKGIGDAFGDEGSPDGACEGDCTGSWYESAYPDGMVGIWQEHSEALQQTPMFGFLNQFQLSPNGTQPDLNVCFNLGAMGDFGCSSFEIPAIIWPFIKIVILISAAFLCRALIFGG